MAGLGFKDFQVGEVLTAADVDGYLMQQSVMRFADSAARGSALGTAAGTGVPLAEGMVSYLDDANQVQVYDGTAWRPTGTILQVVRATDATTRTTTSTSYTDASISVSVTPLSADSTLYVYWYLNIYSQAPGGSGSSGGRWQITTSANATLSGAEGAGSVQGQNQALAQPDMWGPAVLLGVVASSDTSARTYKGRFRSESGGVVRCDNTKHTGQLIVYEVL